MSPVHSESIKQFLSSGNQQIPQKLLSDPIPVLKLIYLFPPNDFFILFEFNHKC